MSALANNTQQVPQITSNEVLLAERIAYFVATGSSDGTVFQQVLQYFAEQRQRDLQSEEQALTTRLNYVRLQLGKPKLSHLCSKCKGAI